MTLILMLATGAVLIFLGLSCRRARLELEEQICDCLHPAVPAAVGFGAAPVEFGPAGPVLTRIDGGREGACAPAGHGRRHLRVVGAR
jgi:hypothetical protein